MARSDKRIFPFFDSVKNPVTSAGTSDSFFNNGYGSFIIEVSNTAAGRVEGCANIVKPDGTTKTDSECIWQPLALVNLKDLSVSESFSAAGQYSAPIGGLSRIRVVLTSVSGATTIIGVAEE